MQINGQTVGDIITIIVQESATTSKDSSTKTSKKSQADVGISQFLYGPQASGLLTKNGTYPGLKFNSGTEFDVAARLIIAKK
jgi:flagellar basal body L-ring protein FlgH